MVSYLAILANNLANSVSLMTRSFLSSSVMCLVSITNQCLLDYWSNDSFHTWSTDWDCVPTIDRINSQWFPLTQKQMFLQPFVTCIVRAKQSLKTLFCTTAADEPQSKGTKRNQMCAAVAVNHNLDLCRSVSCHAIIHIQLISRKALTELLLFWLLFLPQLL